MLLIGIMTLMNSSLLSAGAVFMVFTVYLLFINGRWERSVFKDICVLLLSVWLLWLSGQSVECFP
jgi:hypothetical protein